ncbi:hypothetical protein bcere0025_53870 [Bacillus cereus F65185]|nr:hypothetical protein bcere0025_53870 [Bacillus cereus F65185]
MAFIPEIISQIMDFAVRKDFNPNVEGTRFFINELPPNRGHLKSL